MHAQTAISKVIIDINIVLIGLVQIHYFIHFNFDRYKIEETLSVSVS